MTYRFIGIPLVLSLLLVLTVPAAGQAQTPAGDRTETSSQPAVPCISVRDMQELTTTEFINVYDYLDEHGYAISTPDTICDTVDYFPLTYARSICNSKVLESTYITVMESLDGLCNYVTFHSASRGDCPYWQELVGELEYTFNSRRSTLQKAILNPRTDKLELYEVVFREEDDGVFISCKNIGEIDAYIQGQKTAVCAYIDSIIATATAAAAAGDFGQALATLDSAYGHYTPRNLDIDRVRAGILSDRIQSYSSRISETIASEDYATARHLCDTLLSFDQSDTAKYERIREILTAQLDGTAARYRKLRPDVYDMVLNRLQDFVNSDIRDHSCSDYDSTQHLDVLFHFRTDRANESSCSITLRDDAGHWHNRLNKERKASIAAFADSLAHLSAIQPIKEEEVYILTDDTIQLSVQLYYKTIKVNPDSRHHEEGLLDRYADTIDHTYFYHAKVSKSELNDDGTAKVTFVPRLPTKRIYTFGQTVKKTPTQSFIDIQLVDFETTSAVSWMPSLIIPGLGTYSQGSRTNITSRALPFFLFGGLGALCFSMEKRFTKDGTKRYQWWDNSVAPIYWEKFGIYVGGACLGVAGAVYLTDIIGAISNCIKNASRTKSIRKDMRNGAVQSSLTQDVIIQ